MNSPNEVDLNQACQYYSIANTPLFLVRKLQADPCVHALRDNFSGQQILDALRAGLAVGPNSTAEAVRPYAFLVALSLLPEIEPLRIASELPAKNWDWYEYVAAILVETFSPINAEMIRIPSELVAPTISYSPEAPVDQVDIIPG